MPKTRRSFSVAALVLLTAYCSLLTAHAQTGGVKGKVRNLRGETIAEATITARQGSKDLSSTHSNNKGEFILDGLAAGRYNFVVDAKGYAAGVKYDVEVKPGKIRELGSSLILMIDRGSQVVIRGSVFYKDGTSVPGCEVEVAVVGDNGQTKTLTTLMTGITGEFSYRRPDVKATYRFTAKFRGVTGTKDLSVDSAAIYNIAVPLPVSRGELKPD
ncbi:MAG TPA: carboxypeptidase-like regulatory domain-containing protein [Pyrinomonadaceae bacterium]|jgi:hypothetical protein|nr:carboxypeptidase-like regulatory domain-containing protein [Pyrinomonadaceae bacterium]